MGVGVSYHISTGTKNKSSLTGADKHNERKYRRKSLGDISSYINFDLSKHNVVLIGTKNLYKDVENLYKKEFKSSVDEYNSRQKRSDRKIYDYFEKISDDKKTNLYTELIIQVGDIDFWKNKTFEDKKKMVGVFEKQLELSQEFYPNFKIANATVHLDESSPHIHVVGVCSSNEELSVKNFPDRKRKKKIGLKNYVSQNEVFTKNNMKEFHQFFDKKSLELFNEVYQTNEVLNDKKFKQEYFELKVYKEYAELIKEYEKKYDELKEKSDKLEDNIKSLKKEKSELDNLKVENIHLRENLKVENQKLKKVKDIKDKVVEKKGLLDKEVKVTLPKDEYNSLVAYAVKGEEFKNKLDKTLIEKDKEISKLKERVKFLERDNEEVSRELIDKTKEVRNLSSELHNYRYADILDKSPKINERYIEKLEAIVPKETAKKLKEQATLEVNYNINDKGNEWER